MVSIILVNYNGLEDTIECIKSIYNSTYKEYRIIIIDNDSEEDAAVLNEYQNVKYIKLESNKGFGVANNIGTKIAVDLGTDYLLYLNNDTVIDRHLIEKLVNRTNDNTITTCAMYYYSNPNELWYGGGEVSYSRGTFRHKGYMKEKHITFVTGCCFMTTEECYHRIGLFDDKYFMYYEDSDYSLKAINNGYTLLYVPDAKLWHKVGRTANKYNGMKTYYLTRNRLYLYDKYSDDFGITARVYTGITTCAKMLINIIKRQSNQPILAGIKDYRSKNMGKNNIKGQNG